MQLPLQQPLVQHQYVEARFELFEDVFTSFLIQE